MLLADIEDFLIDFEADFELLDAFSELILLFYSLRASDFTSDVLLLTDLEECFLEFFFETDLESEFEFERLDSELSFLFAIFFYFF